MQRIKLETHKAELQEMFAAREERLKTTEQQMNMRARQREKVQGRMGWMGITRLAPSLPRRQLTAVPCKPAPESAFCVCSGVF